jgi:TatD DNase family protein
VAEKENATVRRRIGLAPIAPPSNRPFARADQSGDSEQLAAYLDLDLFIGITGWVCDERRGQALQQAIPSLPLERLLLETDAPYLLPRDLRPAPRDRRNEPRHLPHIAQRIAELKQVPVADVARSATANTEALFALPTAATAATAG